MIGNRRAIQFGVMVAVTATQNGGILTDSATVKCYFSPDHSTGQFNWSRIRQSSWVNRIPFSTVSTTDSAWNIVVKLYAIDSNGDRIRWTDTSMDEHDFEMFASDSSALDCGYYSGGAGHWDASQWNDFDAVRAALYGIAGVEFETTFTDCTGAFDLSQPALFYFLGEDEHEYEE